jgi:pimeloyl-ACP methyl ester carboxylesterase
MTPIAAPRTTPAEQTRARYPDEAGYIERHGVKVFWERYGEGEPAVLFLPTWSIVHSRCWKAQIPYFARHSRVLTFDPRGNGRSDRPPDAAAYAEAELAADALAVMDATNTERAVLVSLSKGAQRALLLAADHPERVTAAAFIGPFFPVSALHGLRWRLMVHPRLRRAMFTPPPVAAGWLKFNGAHWRADYPDFVEWFMRRVYNTQHSTKQIEDSIAWALETDAETLIATVVSDLAAAATRREQTALARRVRCPVLVLSAPNDKITAHADAKALARATGGQLVSIRDGGHNPHARKPVGVNLALRRFIELTFTADSREVYGASTAE